MKRGWCGLFLMTAALGRGQDLSYATGFRLEKRADYELVQVMDPANRAKPGLSYALYPRALGKPKDLPSDAMAIAVPVSRVALTSSTQVALLALLRLQSKIIGLASAFRVNDPGVRARVESGEIAEISSGPEMSGGLNLETLARLKPDLVMGYPTGDPSSEIQPKLREAGFQAVVDTEYLESAPLGRTEWIKFMGAFFCEGREAARIFNRIEKSYKSLAGRAQRAKDRPLVFLNTGFQGTWWVPQGESYMATFLRDAGADYVFGFLKGHKTTAMNAEEVFSKAQDADDWLLTDSISRLEELSRSDQRLKFFRAFTNGRVYSCDAKVNARGGNDFWEGGMARPDLVLKDLVKIFHPGLVPGHEWIWYKKLE